MSNTAKKNAIKFTDFAQMAFTPKIVYQNKIDLEYLLRFDQDSPLIQNYIIPSIPRKILELLVLKNGIISQKDRQNILKYDMLKHYTSKQRQVFLNSCIQAFNTYRTPSKQDKPRTTFSKISMMIKLSEKHILIGNQNQIDMFELTLDKDQINNTVYLFTENFWSLNMKSGVIKSLAMTRQIKNQNRIFALASGKQINIYSLVSKVITQNPKKIYQIRFEKEIVKISFIKKQFLLVFFIDSFQIFELSELKGKLELISAIQRNYDNFKDSSFLLYDISQIVQNGFKIFFTSNQEQNTFGLYYLQIFLTPACQFILYPSKKVYDIKNKLKSNLIIHNYSREIIFINLGSELVAIKNGLVIDNANVNFRDKSFFIKYFQEKDSIVHIQTDKIEQYEFILSTEFNPQKIIITPKDSIKYSIPENSQFLNLIDTKTGYSIFFQQKFQTNSSPRTIKYWFSISFQLTVLQKLKQIFPDASQIQQSSMEQLQIICDTAIKMGLSQKQAYLQIWKRSFKDTQKSFKVLLSINDFDIIFEQIQMACKKSLKLRDILKIFKSFQIPLKQTVLSEKCTQKDIINFLKCSFFLLKLETFKDIERYRKRKSAQGQRVGFQIMQEGPLKDILQLNKTFIRLQPQHVFSQKSQTNNNLSSLGEIPQTVAQQTKQLKIGIKAFKYYFQLNIKSFILTEIGEFLYSPSIGDHIMVMRYFIKNFRLLYRYLYEQILDKILQQHKMNCLCLIKAFPQLLPIEQKVAVQKNGDLIQTIWTEIDEKSLLSNVFFPQLQTIQNREILRSIPSNLWIKRNVYTYHGIIFNHSSKILQQCNSLKSKERFFYIFYVQMFQERDKLEQKLCRMKEQNLTKDPESGLKQSEINENLKKIKNTLQYVRRHYRLLPYNLKYYSQIYFELYYHIGRQDQYIQKYSFVKFIQLSNYELFKLYFSKEKISKGYILDIIYELYQQKLNKGRKIFRRGLEEYFLSEKESAVSDLKVILNRFNNKDKDYQMKNQKLFVLLIDCLIKVVRIGKNYNINLEQELLVYLNDVVFSEDNQYLIHKLRFLDRVNFDIEILETIDADMTILQIQQNGQLVIQKMFTYFIKKYAIKQIQDYSRFKLFSFLVVSNVNSMRTQLYREKHKQFAYFLYLTEIMKEQRLVQYATDLLSDEYLSNFFQVSVNFKQSLFFYMYNWCVSDEHAKYRVKMQFEKRHPDKIFSFQDMNEEMRICLKEYRKQNAIYLNHNDYIKSILHLLDTNNLDRKFVQLQLQYADSIKSLGCNVTYPLSLTLTVPTLNQIQTHLQSCQQITLVDANAVRHLFVILDEMREMYEPEVKQNLQRKKNWFIKEIYELFFCKLLQNKRFRQATAIIQDIFRLPHCQESVVIYPIITIQHMIAYFPEKNKYLLIQLISYFFYWPQELTKIVTRIINESMTTLEFQSYIKTQIDQIKKTKKARSYTMNNFLFKSEFIQSMTATSQIKLKQRFNEEKEHQNQICLNISEISECRSEDVSIETKQQEQTDKSIIFERILDYSLNHLLNSKQQLKKNKIWRILFKIICQSPYSAAKFIFCQIQSFDIKDLRAFFSFLIQQVVFQPYHVLNFSICIHEILLYRTSYNITMDQIIKQYLKNDFPQPHNIKKPQTPKLRNAQILLFDSLSKMEQKLIFYEEKKLSDKIKTGWLKVNKDYQRRQELQKVKIMKKFSRGEIEMKGESIENLSSAKFRNQNLSVLSSCISEKLNSMVQVCEQYGQAVKIKMSKHESFSYNSVDEIFKNPEILKELIQSNYLFGDKDSGYQINPNDQLQWKVDINFPTNVEFNQRTKRHQIFENNNNKRFDASKIERHRRKSKYFQQTFNSKIKAHKFGQLTDSLDTSQIRESSKKSMLNVNQPSQQHFFMKNNLINQKKIFSQDLLFVPNQVQISSIRRRRSQVETQNSQSIRVLKKKLSIQQSLQWAGDQQKNVNLWPSAQIIEEQLNESHRLANLFLSISRKHESSQLKPQIISKCRQHFKDTEDLTELKRALRIIYNNQNITIETRFKILQIILSEFKIQDYVPQHLEWYKLGTNVTFINYLIRKFSSVFPFQGLFYSKRLHEEKRNHQKAMNIFFSLESIESSPKKVPLFVQQQNEQNSSKDRLFKFIIDSIREKLDHINVGKIAEMIGKCFSDQKYFKLVYFELMISTAGEVIERRTIERLSDDKIEEIDKIRHLIEEVDDDNFIETQLSQMPELQYQEKQLISDILDRHKEETYPNQN